VSLRGKCDAGGKNLGADCSNLGWITERGLGVEVDLPRAAALYRRACEVGAPIACFNLGVLQVEGRGTQVDLRAARGSFDRSCKRGHAAACARLAALPP
jgi:TPR repeat protein